jgi:hypothetical protein
VCVYLKAEKYGLRMDARLRWHLLSVKADDGREAVRRAMQEKATTTTPSSS